MQTNAQLASQITALLQQWNAREAEFRGWLAGTPDGGPNGDGRYPLTDASGRTVLVDAPSKLSDTVGGPAGLSTQARLLAEAARDVALGYRDSAALDAQRATTAKTEATDARNMAKVYRDDAASHAANLQVTRTAVASDRETAQLARDEAVAAKDTAVIAKGDTLVARAEAVVARDAAEAYATSINPSLLATKSDLAAQIAALVDSAPATLNTLKEFATALGNDPNFATTITAQLAGKAASVHSHGIAEIAGLQTALDQKQPVGSYLGTSGGTLAGILTLKDTSGTASAMGQFVSFKDGANVERGWIGYGWGNSSFGIKNNIGPILLNGRDVLAELDVKPSLSAGADLRTAGQIRATGWYGSQRGNGEGLGVEIGVSGGTGYVYSYDRSGAAYGPLNLGGTAITLAAPTTVSGNLAVSGAVQSTKFTVNGEVNPDGVPWYGLGVKGNEMHLTGYYGIQLRSEAANVILRTPQGMHVQNAAGASRGYLWHDTSGFGLLDSAGNWRVQTTTSGVNLWGAAYAQSSLDVLGSFTPRKGLRPYGVGTDSGAVPESYTWGYQQAGPWAHPYPDLILGYYTGIKIGGHYSYGGTRFYNDHPDNGGAAELFSVGNGDSHVRVANNLYVASELYLKGNTAQPIRPNRLYRRDDASAYNVQTHWTGTHWFLRGYADDTFHAECRVGYADSAGNASTLGGYAVADLANVPGNRRIVSATQPSGMVAGDIWLKPI